MAEFDKLRPAIVLRRVPKNGHAKSDHINDFMEQSVHDFSIIIDKLNQVVLPILGGLEQPVGSDLDPVGDGLDGQVIFTNKDWTSYTDPKNTYYYDNSKTRHKSIYETIDLVLDDVNIIYKELNQLSSRIGTTSSSSSGSTGSSITLAELETKLNNQTSLLYKLRADNADYLTSSEIETAIENETLDPSSFHIRAADIESNAGIAPTSISGVDLTTSYTYTGGVPSNFDIRDSILRLKEWVEDFSGETFTVWSGTNVTSGTFRDHVETLGTGSVTDNNPHGLDVADLSDSDNLLARPQVVASFDFRISGNSSYSGGYFYVATDFDLLNFAVTLETPGTSGISAKLYKVTTGGSTVLVNSGVAVGTTPTPGSSSASLAGKTALQGEMLFVSGITGDGLNARAIVFGYPG